MIVRWPGTVAAETKCDHYLMIEDFFPTILEIAGVKHYNTVQERDGISFLPLLTGKGKCPLATYTGTTRTVGVLPARV